MSCTLAFDFGMKSIGVAVGQSITGTAAPLNALPARDGIPNWDLVGDLMKEWQPEQLIVGLPLNMDGTEQEVTLAAKKFARRLNGRYNLPVDTHDERLTTVDAKAELFARKGYKSLTKGKVDSVSAVLILESWYESQY